MSHYIGPYGSFLKQNPPPSSSSSALSSSAVDALCLLKLSNSPSRRTYGDSALVTVNSFFLLFNFPHRARALLPKPLFIP